MNMSEICPDHVFTKHNKMQYIVLAGIVVALLGSGFGFSRANNAKSFSPYSSIDYNGAILTVEHDGHLFIVEGQAGKGSILHHPDCPCFKALPIDKQP